MEPGAPPGGKWCDFQSCYGGQLTQSGLTAVIKEHVVALLATSVALGCRLVLDPYLGDHLPYATFFVSIAFTTWYAGVSGALTATLLGGLAAIWFFVPPRFSLDITGLSEQVGLVLYGAVGLTFTTVGYVMHRARRRAEELAQGLRVTEERLTLAQRASQVGSFDWNLETGLTSWSPELYTMYGLQPDDYELTQARWESCLHPDDRHEMVEAVERSRRSGEPEDREFRIVRPNGEIRWLAGRWRWLRDRAGKPVRLTGVNFDITDRKQDQEALQLSQHRYRELIHSLPAAVYTCDAQGRIQLYNQAAVILWGREPEIGKDLWCGSWKIYRPDGTPLPLDECPMAVTLREGRAVRGEEIVIERPDGSKRHVVPHPEPIRDASNTVIGAISMLIDVTEQNRIDDRLRETENRTRAIFESSLDALITMDADGLVQDFNPAAEKTFGYTQAYALGRPVAELIIPPRLRESHQVGLRRYLETGEASVIGRRIQMPALRADGSEIPVEFSIAVTRRRGRPPFFTAYLRDISDRQRSERATAHLAAIVASSDDAIVSKNLQGLVTSWNRAAERLFGYRADEMIGRPVTLIIPADRQDEERRILEEISRGRTVEPYETIRRRKDGSDVHVSLTVSPLFDTHGKVIGASKIARDITHRAEQDRALKESRERLRNALVYQEAVINNIGEGLYTVNRQGLVISMNQAAEKLFGWGKEELLGRKMHDVTHYKHRDGTPFPAHDCAGLQVLQKGTPLSNHQDVFVRKDGTCFDVVYSAMPIRAGEEIAGLVVVFRDVTEEKRAEQALRDRDRALTMANDELIHQKSDLADANKELQSFSYSVSHDLRAPLRTIDAYIRIVEEDHGPHLNSEARRCLGIVRKAAGQAGELIDDLLEFSRLGRIGMDFRPTKMVEIAQEVADELKLTQDGRTVDLTIGDLPACQGDWRLLKLVWTNLLANAFKFTRSRPVAQIEVGWLPDDRQPDASVYFVRDNGVGFDMKYMHKLFGVFQRLHLKEEFEGTGVGLAIVQRIVQRHGGRVWAEGKVDGGATFFFSLRKALR